jgi:hypothetical protein
MSAHTLLCLRDPGISPCLQHVTHRADARHRRANLAIQTDASKPPRPELPHGEILGHPKALWQLSNVEMWERFS